MQRILNPDEWRRVGRGRVQSFDLSVEAVQEVLVVALPDDYRPYYLLAFSMVKRGTLYTPHCEQIGFDQLAQYVGAGMWNFNLGSHVLTPELGQLKVMEVPLATLSTNGLINVQCGLRTKKDVQRPSFGIVDKVGNLETHEVVVHSEYFAVYRRLCAAAKARVRTGQSDL